MGPVARRPHPVAWFSLMPSWALGREGAHVGSMVEKPAVRVFHIVPVVPACATARSHLNFDRGLVRTELRVALYSLAS